MRRQLPFESETCWFLLFAVLDYYMTYTLLYVSVFIDNPVVEVNPLASSLGEVAGERGLLLWRLGWATITCCGVQFIATKRRRMARGLLIAGTAVAIGIVVYQSALLLVSTRAVAGPEWLESLMTIGG